MKHSASVLLFLLSVAVPGICSDIWYVPDDFSRGIQSALSDPSVQNGDTVIVRAGTYQENINFLGKAVWLISESGPEVTVIDGGRKGTVVTFENSEGSDSILDGFKITNGAGIQLAAYFNYYYGGGILCVASSPTIQNNIVTENAVESDGMEDSYGCGIACLDSSARIMGNEISHNFNDMPGWIYGAGIYCYQSDMEISDNLIMANSTDGGTWPADRAYGGGICCMSSQVAITGNTIESNRLVTDWQWGTYWRCYGGGLYCEDSSVILDHNVIRANYVRSYNSFGAGIWSAGSDIVIANNLVVDNENDCSGWGKNYLSPFPPPPPPETSGGGITAGGSSEVDILIINNTVYGNSIKMETLAAGIACALNASVVNNIVWGNIGGIEISGGILSYCDVEGGASGSQCIAEDPHFVDPEGGDFHLDWRSPCINRGTKDNAPDTDLDGNLRPFMGAVDMGAYEYTGLHTLSADVFEISQSLGGTVLLGLNAGMENAGRDYIVLGGYTGTVPGLSLPGGDLSVPVNWDAFTTLVWSLYNTPHFLNFYGQIDGTGQSWAQVNSLAGPLPPKYAGHTMYYAFTLDYPWDFVSNPIAVDVLP